MSNNSSHSSKILSNNKQPTKTRKAPKKPGKIDNYNELEVGYQLCWIGKKLAKQQAEIPTETVIVPDAEHNSKPENKDSGNVFITGDNIDALKHLTNSYLGKIKMIYIDPPYNTGSGDFVYNDTFTYSPDQLKKNFGWGQEELAQYHYLNNAGKSSHSAWLSFMYPRLVLAKLLLTDDGVICIHIDEHEYTNLEKILAEIFGHSNDLGTIVWDKRNPKGDATGISLQHELILIFSKNKEDFIAKHGLKRPKENASAMIEKVDELVKSVGAVTDEVRRQYKKWISGQNFSGGEKAYNLIDDTGNIYQSVSMAWPNKEKAPDDYFVPLIHPETRKVCPVPERGWRNPSKTMNELLKRGIILFGQDETTQPRRKYVLKDNLYENVPSLLYYGGSDDALLSSIEIPFNNPKPVIVSKKLISYVSNRDDIILDFFAGSATTAHAVMELNAEDGGNRRFICVQWAESTAEKSVARSMGFNTIDEISKERIQRAAHKIRSENNQSTIQQRETPLDLGFTSYTLKLITDVS